MVGKLLLRSKTSRLREVGPRTTMREDINESLMVLATSTSALSPPKATRRSKPLRLVTLVMVMMKMTLKWASHKSLLMDRRACIENGVERLEL